MRNNDLKQQDIFLSDVMQPDADGVPQPRSPAGDDFEANINIQRDDDVSMCIKMSSSVLAVDASLRWRTSSRNFSTREGRGGLRYFFKRIMREFTNALSFEHTHVWVYGIIVMCRIFCV